MQAQDKPVVRSKTISQNKQTNKQTSKKLAGHGLLAQQLEYLLLLHRTGSVLSAHIGAHSPTPK